VTNNASLSGTSITLGQPNRRYRQLRLSEPSAVLAPSASPEDSDTQLSGNSSAASLVLTSTGSILDDADQSTILTAVTVSLSAGDGTLGASGNGDLDFSSTTLTANSSAANANPGFFAYHLGPSASPPPSRSHCGQRYHRPHRRYLPGSANLPPAVTLSPTLPHRRQLRPPSWLSTTTTKR
jgi:hypothetical protein